MVFNKVLAAVSLAASVAGCAQVPEAEGAQDPAHGSRGAPVATSGPDDGLPFNAASLQPAPPPPAGQGGALPAAAPADGGAGGGAPPAGR